jgi:hypothetical protein
MEIADSIVDNFSLAVLRLHYNEWPIATVNSRLWPKSADLYRNNFSFDTASILFSIQVK